MKEGEGGKKGGKECLSLCARVVRELPYRCPLHLLPHLLLLLLLHPTNVTGVNVDGAKKSLRLAVFHRRQIPR